jgi:predicted AlkP superfamily pyrophosphatase or phosphodiesterase
VSSTYYFSDLPQWVKDFNAGRMADQYKGKAWMARALPAESGGRLYSRILATPLGNDLLAAFVERAIEAEQLGLGDRVDLLSISFSSNDYVGHEFGPDSPEVREMCRRTDEQLGRLLRFVDSKIGLKDTLVVLTADHGVGPIPDAGNGRKSHGGRMKPHIVRDTLQRALSEKYGAGDWIIGSAEHSVYLNPALLREKGLEAAEVRNTAAAAARGISNVMRVYTHEQLTSGAAQADYISRRVMNSFFAPRAADLYILLESHWLFGSLGASHGTAFSYDSHIPLIFMGAGLRPGNYFDPVALNDVAPTLCALLELETPSGSTGRVLAEIFEGKLE